MTKKESLEGTAWMLWVMIVAILFTLLFILAFWMVGTRNAWGADGADPSSLHQSRAVMRHD
jgi:hypothetical protein